MIELPPFDFGDDRIAQAVAMSNNVLGCRALTFALVTREQKMVGQLEHELKARLLRAFGDTRPLLVLWHPLATPTVSEQTWEDDGKPYWRIRCRLWLISGSGLVASLPYTKAEGELTPVLEDTPE